MEQRDFRITNIRAISCIAVVILHTFFACYGVFKPDDLQYDLSVIIRNLMFWAVPCFFMVTGALLLDPKRNVDYPKILKKYIPRMLIALFVFSFIFKFIDILLGLDDLTWGTLVGVLKDIVIGQGWNHMWYLYTMVALYLLIPLIRPFIKLSQRKEQITFLVILSLFLSIFPFICALLKIETAFYIPVYTIYPLYLLMGYILYNKYFDCQSIVMILILGYIAGITAFTRFYLNNNDETIKGLVNSYSFPVTVFGAVGMFMLLRSISRKIRILEFIDNNSFGIYLMHMIPIKVFCIKSGFDPYSIGTWFVFVVAAGVFMITLFTTALIRKIPIVSKIL